MQIAAELLNYFAATPTLIALPAWYTFNQNDYGSYNVTIDVPSRTFHAPQTTPQLAPTTPQTPYFTRDMHRMFSSQMQNTDPLTFSSLHDSGRYFSFTIQPMSYRPCVEPSSITKQQRIEQHLITEDIMQGLQNPQLPERGPVSLGVSDSLYAQYQFQRNQIVNNCIQALRKSPTACLNLVHSRYILNDASYSRQLNEILETTISKFCDAFYDKQGAATLPDKKEYYPLTEVLCTYMRQYLTDEQLIEYIHRECADLAYFKQFERYITGRLEPIAFNFKLIAAAFKELVQSSDYFEKRKKLILENSFNQNLQRIQKLCQNEQFAQAHAFIEHLKKDNPLKQQFLNAFAQELIANSTPLQALKSIDPRLLTSPLIYFMRHGMMERLSKDRDQYSTAQLLFRTLYTQPQNYWYKKADMEIYPCDQLEHECMVAYKALCNEYGLPLCFSYNQQALSQGFAAKEQIISLQHLRERSFLFKFATLKCPPHLNDLDFQQAIITGLSYLQAAVKNPDRSYNYTVLAAAIYYALTHKHTSQAILNCNSFLLPEQSDLFSLHEFLLEQAIMFIRINNDRNPDQPSLFSSHQATIDNALYAESQLWQNALLEDEYPQRQACDDICSIAEHLYFDELSYIVPHSKSSIPINSSQRSIELVNADDSLTTLITLHIGPISNFEFNQYEQAAIHRQDKELIPSLNTIKAINLYNTLNSTIELFQDALLLWYGAPLLNEREAAAIAIQCGEIAALYIPENKTNHFAELFTSIGQHILNFAQVAPQLMVSKYVTLPVYWALAHQKISGGELFDTALKNAISAFIPLRRAIQLLDYNLGNDDNFIQLPNSLLDIKEICSFLEQQKPLPGCAAQVTANLRLLGCMAGINDKPTLESFNHCLHHYLAQFFINNPDKAAEEHFASCILSNKLFSIAAGAFKLMQEFETELSGWERYLPFFKDGAIVLNYAQELLLDTQNQLAHFVHFTLIPAIGWANDIVIQPGERVPWMFAPFDFKKNNNIKKPKKDKGKEKEETPQQKREREKNERKQKRENWKETLKKNVQKELEKHGYRYRKDPPFDTHGQPAYQHIKTGEWITLDVDGHNGGVWKKFDRRGKNRKTLDKDFNPIGD